ncbi:hypothetical protein GALMADRAFT_242700 [Galerina marginata CBS 339.88]|uniref:HNH nuclease domain-containing protein n=1 Tax=Galerina marginata (strain CBS 339.88) TaxID=685588 RepID=A0A067TDA1_GALM3|nr:hypothetical protein GALMADRAFT_242700 [Galerina marginata CBS 339.88]
MDTLSSLSSRASLNTYESLKDEIVDVSMAGFSLQELVHAAERIINQNFAPDLQHTYAYQMDDETVSVNLDQVMSAMLEHAEECGGDEAKRYVASAIVACSRREECYCPFNELILMSSLVKTRRLPNDHEEPDELATPTRNKTTSYVEDGVGQRIGSFPDDVMMRDGHRCILTGFQSVNHPFPDKNALSLFLEVVHIFRRAVGNFDEDTESDSYISAMTTFDILANYFRIPRKTFEDLQDHLDDPSNGMILEKNAQMAYDRFFWCLKPTGKENEYTVKVFEMIGVLRLPPNNLVTFRDKSNDFTPSGNSFKQNGDIPPPNPRHLAIHAAIAEILHQSGAGKFLDKLLDIYDIYGDDEGEVPPVRSWIQLEKLEEERALRDAIEAMQL